jgi:hypothetical protein
LGYQTKEDAMNRACDMYWGGDKSIVLVGRPFKRCRIILRWILNRMKGNGQDSFGSG